MKKEALYKTHQRSDILNFIKKTKKKHITADDINHYFKIRNDNISQSTIYRYLNVLVNDGKIRKYLIDEKIGACYQYVKQTDECTFCLHLKCQHCGKLFHADIDEFHHLESELKKKYNFMVDNTKTVLYGTCNECMKEVI